MQQIRINVLPTAVVISIVILLSCSRTNGQQLQESRDHSHIRLAGRSPLATDGKTIYAVQDDGRTIVSRSLDLQKDEWSALLPENVFRRVSGLAYSNGNLYVVDQGSSTLYRISLQELTPTV